MNYKLEIISPVSKFATFHGEKTTPPVVFRIKKDLKAPVFKFEDVDLFSFINTAKNNFLLNFPNLSKDQFTWVNFKKYFYENNTFEEATRDSLYVDDFMWCLRDSFDEISDQALIIKQTNFIMLNLKNVVEANIFWEKELINNVKEEKEFFKFKRQHEILKPLINIFFNSNNIFQKYYIEYHSIVQIHSEKRGNIKPFLAAGSCSYNVKIFMNTSNIKDYNRWGRMWENFSIQGTFLHELGHAIDHAFINHPKIFPHLNSDKKLRVSETVQFKTLTKRAYINTRPLSRRNRKAVNYYTAPRVIINKEAREKVKYDWHRANCENFAESFLFISSWMVNGFTRSDSYMIGSDRSNQRIRIKTFMSSLRFILKECNWEYLGVPTNLINKRKRLIKHFLEKIDKLPLVLKGDKVKSYSTKVNTFNKPILRKLIN